MNKKPIYFLSTILLTLTQLACEQEIVENDLSFQEKLVVRSILTAGNLIEVYFGRTLPLNIPFDPEKANLSDVFAYVKNNNTIDTLIHTGSGIYRTSSMIARNGEEFEMFAEWNNKTAFAVTQVPFSTTFQNGRLVEENVNGETTFYIQGLLDPRPGAVYGATWSIINSVENYRLEDSVISVLLRESDKNLQNRLTIKSRDINPELVQQWRNSFFIRVHAFDEEFYNFFITQDANNATNNVFSQSGINLRWNIEGDAIGMFIGKSDFLIKIP
jgi:hypothetical protein